MWILHINVCVLIWLHMHWFTQRFFSVNIISAFRKLELVVCFNIFTLISFNRNFTNLHTYFIFNTILGKKFNSQINKKFMEYNKDWLNFIRIWSPKFYFYWYNLTKFCYYKTKTTSHVVWARLRIQVTIFFIQH